MGGKHFTKKADPAYPFLDRDRRGKMQHTDELQSLSPVLIFKMHI